MNATILDTVTGKRARVFGINAWQWAENNWSCDCNRNPWHADTGKPDGICQGCERFLVVDAEFEPGDDRYTLAELNASYPPELLKAHGIIQENASALQTK